MALGALVTLILAIGAWFYIHDQEVLAAADAAKKQVQMRSTATAVRAKAGPPSEVRRPGLAVPARYRFAGVGSVAAATDETDLLARYTLAQRRLIKRFYAAYGAGREGGGPYAFSNVFSFHTHDQLGWLASQGFPTPDDVLAAAMMSDEELKALSDEGNFKAGVFYLGRQLAQPPKVGDAVNRPALADEVDKLKLAGELLSEGSAFGPYAYAQYALASGQRGMALASLGYAKQLGDMRDDFALAFAEANPDIPPLEVLTGYQLVQSTSMKNPRLRDLSALARRPRFEVFPNE